MKNLIYSLFTLLPLITLAQPTGYTGARLNGTNMTNQIFVYNSPGITPTNSRLLLEQKDSTYYRCLYKAFRVDYLGSASSIYLKTDASGNFQIAPITDIFNPTNYYTKTASDARYLQSFTEQDPIYIADSALYARKTYTYSKVQSDARYLQSFTELDPIFSASVAFGITSGQITNWNTAFSWGNHAGLYPLLTGSYSNPTWITSLPWTKITGTPTIYSFTGTNLQYTKGDGTYATFPTNLSSFSNDVGYLTGITSAQITTALGYTPYNGTLNPLGFLTGITSGQVTTALGFTPTPTTRTLTINGTSLDLSANRSWSVGTVTNVTSTDNTTATVANGTTTPAITIVAAPKLQTARNINGVSFDGTANITIPGSAITGIPNSSLTNSSITINGNSVALGGSTTVTASPSISAPVTGNTITSGTAFQPRAGGPCNILINTNVSGLVGVGTSIVVTMSPTSGGTYVQVATDAASITILGLGDKASGLIPVPTGYWVRVTYTAVGLATITGNYTRWDL